jgi:hypothetical protein
MDPSTYCREIEAYLCRKNDGHLVRVVGPAFNMVSGWAASGVPFKVACRGIDQCFERYYAKGPRRRPVRVEFCEADVLDAFDEWRRAVGIGIAGTAAAGEADTPGSGSSESGAVGVPEPRSGGLSLRAHLDRVVTRLTDLQARGVMAPGIEAVVERAIDRLSGDRETSRTLRGEARQAYIERLERLDGELMQAVRQATPADVMATLRDEAADQLAGFRARMPPDAYDKALEAATTKLLRERLKLPVIAYAQG